MSSSDKRLLYLEKVTREGTSDPFAWYGLALEYKKLGRSDEAFQTFVTLRQASADYLPMYLMCGQMLAELERPDEAREWLEAGMALAKTKGDAHAQGELEAALDGLA